MSRVAPSAATSVTRSPFRFILQGDKAGRAIIVGSALAAALISLCVFAPRYWLWPGVGTRPGDLLSIEPELHRAFFALQQLQDPWQPIENNSNQVIEWRLLWPAIGHYARLPANVYLSLPQVGCLLTLLVSAGVIWRGTRNAWCVAGATLLAATASWFFVSTGWLAYFDSWLILLLLLASFAQTRSVLAATALFAPWIDERFILALPLCLGVRAVLADDRGSWKEGFGWDAGIMAAAVVPYLLVRFVAEFFHYRETSQAYWVHRPALPGTFGVMTEGAWEGLRLGWLGVLACLVFAFRQKRGWIAAVAVLGSLALNLSIADDLSRSASMALPAALGGMILAWRWRPTLTLRVLPWLGLGNLLLPAAHVIANPFFPGETYHRIPLASAFTEHAHARHPPEFANAAAYNQRGLDAYQAGNLPQALRSFDAALRFDPTLARARANRGLIRFIGGRQAEALTDLDQALREQPDLLVARMQRAAVREQCGDKAGALADVQEVLRRAPPDWKGRNEAVELERTLAAKPTG